MSSRRKSHLVAAARSRASRVARGRPRQTRGCKRAISQDVRSPNCSCFRAPRHEMRRKGERCETRRRPSADPSIRLAPLALSLTACLSLSTHVPCRSLSLTARSQPPPAPARSSLAAPPAHRYRSSSLPTTTNTNARPAVLADCSPPRLTPPPRGQAFTLL